MDKDRKSTGREGEEIACNFLMKNGHTILRRNFRSGHFEIDIISLDREGIHFVEVKTRRPPLQAGPEMSVTATKQRRLAAAARSYLNNVDETHGLGMMECFFDVVSIVIDGEQTSLQYFPKAFIPIYT